MRVCPGEGYGSAQGKGGGSAQGKGGGNVTAASKDQIIHPCDWES